MAVVPNVAASFAGIAAVSDVLLTNVVGRSAPPHRITDIEEKLDPVTVSVNSLAPAARPVGVSEVITGTGSDVRPVPDRFAVLGLKVASLAIVNEPLRVPASVGENVTIIEQPPPGGTGATQLLFDVKSPEAVTEVTVRSPVPLLNTKIGLDVELPI